MKKINAKSRAKLMGVAALLAPVCAVQGARMFLNGGPAAASAAPVREPAAMPDAPSATPLDEAQRRAIAWLALNADRAGSARSPMEQPEPEEADEPETTQSGTDEPVTEEDLPTLKLTGIMSSAERTVAFINHRVYTTGDEIIQGWVVTEILPRERAVVLRHATGRTLTLMQPTPGRE